MQPKISISNLFFMLVYAWSYYKPGQLKLFDAADYEKPVDFLAALLCEVVNDNIVHNLSKRHTRKSERLRTVRGRIEVGKTLLSPDWKSGFVVCSHPVVVVDTLENQLIKATLNQISSSSDVHKNQRIEARKLCSKLAEVSNIAATKQLFRRAIIDQSMKRYRFPLSICELFLDQKMAANDSGNSWFKSFLRDEVAMRNIFEAFVRGLLRHKLRINAKIGGKKLPPFMMNVENGDTAMVPSMRTDVTVQTSEKTLVIDTKYTPHIFQNYFGSHTIRSDHFYQIQAYVSHSIGHYSTDMVAGMVIYPKVERDLQLEFETNGSKFVFCTLDLTKDWREVESDLISLVKNYIH